MMRNLNNNHSKPMDKMPPAPVPDAMPDPVPSLEITLEEEPSVKTQDLDALVKRTVEILQQGIHHTKKGWKDILSGALRLHWLKRQHKAQGARNDLVPDETKSGFGIVLKELSLPRATAKRWMDRALEFAVEIGVNDQNFPVPDSSEWERMVTYVRGRVELLDLLGLPIRSIPIPKDDEIMMRLRVAAEAGHECANQLLQELEAGDTTMDEATNRDCQVEKESKRTLPALLRLDPKTLRPKGRAVKALDTMEEFFAVWDQLPREATLQARARIREVFAKMPPECGLHQF